MPRLTAMATALPPHVIHQDAAKDGARRIFEARSPHFERMSGVFDHAGIATRRSCVPIEWYQSPHSWPERNGLYLEHAVALLEEAARRCLDQAGLEPAAIDLLLTVSTTGIATPSLEARLIERMAFRRDVTRLPVFGLGCAGGVLGLGHAAALAASGQRVLLLVVELCGLTFRRGDLSKSNIVAAALFGDGAAALLIEPGDGCGRGAIRGWGEHTWPDSLGVMGWSVEEDGFGVIFSQDIPHLVGRDLKPAAERFLDGQGLSLSDLAGVVCHPGGRKVVDAIGEAFALAPAALAEENAVLHDCGNMSAATVLFVLERKRLHAARGLYLMSALGPGFTAAFALIEL